MKRCLIEIGLTLVLSGCASLNIGETETQHEWLAEHNIYMVNCKAWIKVRNQHLENRKPDEVDLPLVVFLHKRCQEDPITCTPPPKQERLIYFEKTYLKPVTADGCVDALQQNIDS